MRFVKDFPNQRREIFLEPRKRHFEQGRYRVGQFHLEANFERLKISDRGPILWQSDPEVNAIFSRRSHEIDILGPFDPDSVLAIYLNSGQLLPMHVMTK